jgi:23S rRNA G2445 N2-methylase RlmL
VDEALRAFALAVPGLGPLLGDELRSIAGVGVRDVGFNGRSDVVLMTVETAALGRVLGVALAEDVFVEIGRTLRSEGDRAAWVAGRLLRPQRFDGAVRTHGALGERSGSRVIVRVLQERSFLRTELRRQLRTVVQRCRPRWKEEDPADAEVWVVEYQPGRFVAGLRLSDAGMRRHQGRAAQRRGALRPTVAAAMIRLAGSPDGVLLDPCCGSGTILEEGLRAGWRVRGIDLDETAVRTAQRNVPQVPVEPGDARRLPIDSGSVGAVVSNLPFGRQYGVDGGMDDWLGAVVGELARVTRAGGRVVLLAPRVPRGLVPDELVRGVRHPVRLLGVRTAIWTYDRR